jgi:drug/metabolite transporter (DMT)-like permease
MSTALALSLLAACCLACGAVMTKEFVDRLPGPQLIGPLFIFNAAIAWPFAPFIDWSWSERILVLHLLSIVALLVVSWVMFSLYAHGTASATTTAQGLSPIPAAILASLFLSIPLEPVQAVAAAVVVAAVLIALPGAFATLERRGATLRICIAACGFASITVLSRLLADQGVSTIEIYVVRTTAAGFLYTICIPPRNVPLSVAPKLFLRASFVTAHFLLVIEAVRRGSPTVVQTALATTPLIAMGVEAVRHGRRPSLRVALCAVAVLAAVALLGLE